MNMNTNYEEKLAALREAVKSIPITTLDSLTSCLIKNAKGDPVLILNVELERVKQNSLHTVLAYDHKHNYWVSYLDTPVDCEEGRYTMFAPTEWQLRVFLLDKLDAMAAALNNKHITPHNNTITTAIMLGDWDGTQPPKDDNLIRAGLVLDQYYAIISLTFTQTEDTSKALFYYDWADHKYYPMGSKDVSDPTQYTLFCVDESCKYIPDHIDTTGILYTLDKVDTIMPKITIQRYETPPMNKEHFDADFPGIRAMMENKEDANHD